MDALTGKGGLRRRLRAIERMEPGIFAMVMATGIVSLAFMEYRAHLLAELLFWLNLVIYAVLLLLGGLRFVLFPVALRANFMQPGRSATFLTLVAGTCVLATQAAQVAGRPALARLLAWWGMACWTGLVYLFFCVIITRRVKATFLDTLDGSWLLVVVATQACALAALLLIELGAGSSTAVELLLLWAVCLFLIGCVWYLVIITLISYRMVFMPFSAVEFTPPYWINMGALAISTLAGSLLIEMLQSLGAFHEALPFLRGVTLCCWAFATWWIPLLILLEAWRFYSDRSILSYSVAQWSMVFPLGMYTVCTVAMARSLRVAHIAGIADVFVYVAGLAWAWVAVGWLRDRLWPLLRRSRSA